MLIPVLTKLTIAKGATSITLKDATGAYNVSTNPGGYGSPNMDSPPVAIGFTFREWSATIPYASLVTDDSGTIAALVSPTGYELAATVISATLFNDGIQQIKYYPFKAFTGTYALVSGSKVITATGYNPTTLGDEYVAALVLSGADVIKSKVLLLTDRDTWTSTTFSVDTAWGDSNVSGYHIMFATEADLKLLITDGLIACLSTKIATLPTKKRCDHKLIDEIIDLTMWRIAAEGKFECEDFDGANQLITKAYELCSWCNRNTGCVTC